jgi:hypothetical protein
VARRAVIGKATVLDFAPIVDDVAVGALAPGGHVPTGAGVAGLAVGIGDVIEGDVFPRIVIGMAARTLTWPVPVWRQMARRTVVGVHVVKADAFTPAIGVVTVGALADVVFLVGW